MELYAIEGLLCALTVLELSMLSRSPWQLRRQVEVFLLYR